MPVFYVPAYQIIQFYPLISHKIKDKKQKYPQLALKIWSDGDTNAERMVTVDGDMSLTATFEATSAGGSGGEDGDGDSAY